jgi:hypothetical protein
MNAKPGDLQDLAQVIASLYRSFASYSLSANFGDGAWLSAEAIQAIRVKPLRELKAIDLDIYANHATSCGNWDDFKYLLPRILELFSAGSLDIIPEMLFLNLADDGWTGVEHEIIDSYLLALWNVLINSFPFFLGPDEYLCSLALIYPDLSLFLNFWDSNHTLPSLRQLAQFATEASYCPSWQTRPIQLKQVTAWLLRPELIQTLEDAVEQYGSDAFVDEFLAASEAIQTWKANFMEG